MQAFLERWSERCNPILVKDVRAAFRGRTFKLMLWGEVFVALVVSFGFVMVAGASQSEISGTGYFAAVFGCLALGVHGLVPFSALHAFGAERDENTLELLVLSGLAAWRLVLGKLASVLLQALLVYSAFLPFLVFAFLLHGMPLEGIAGALAVSASVCTAQCAAGLALGSLARSRLARVFVSVVFLIGLLYMAPVVVMMFLGSSGFVSGAVLSALATIVVVALTAAIGGATIAAVVLAHAEENRSTPIRVATTFVFVVGCAFAVLADTIEGSTMLLAVTLACMVPTMFCVTTEKEALPRVVAARLPPIVTSFRPLAAWLPGGARGALFVLYHLVLVLIVQVAINVLRFGHGLEFDGYFMRLLAGTLVLAVFLLLPSAILARHTVRPSGVAAMRLVIAGIVTLVILAPLIASMPSGKGPFVRWSPAMIPASFDNLGRTTELGPWLLLIVLALLALALNVPRIVRADRELRERSALLREREALRAQAVQ